MAVANEPEAGASRIEHAASMPVNASPITQGVIPIYILAILCSFSFCHSSPLGQIWMQMQGKQPLC